MLAPQLFNMIFRAGLRAEEKRFLADAAIMDNMVQLQQKEKGEKKCTPPTGKVNEKRGNVDDEVHII